METFTPTFSTIVLIFEKFKSPFLSVFSLPMLNSVKSLMYTPVHHQT